MNDFYSSIEKYFEGRLTPKEEHELAHILSTEPKKAAEFVLLYEQDRLLAFRSAPANLEVIDNIMAQIQREEDPFVQSVLREIPAAQPNLLPFPTAGRAVRRIHFLPHAIAASFLILAAFWYFGPTMGKPVLAEITGTANFLRAGETLSASAGALFFPGDILQTSSTSIVTIAFGPEKTRLTLFPAAELRLNALSGGKQFFLRSGKLEASVARQRPFRPMLIRTPQAEARVLGTRLEISSGPSWTRLEVFEGKVRFTRTSDQVGVDVAAGHYAIASADADLAALPIGGRILHETWISWTSYPGNFLAAITSDPELTRHPAARAYLRQFQTPPTPAPGMGQRVRGYLLPPVTGGYRFSISVTGPGEGVLFLSRNEDPKNRTHIDLDYTREQSYARPVGAPAPGAENQLPIRLVAGRRYYVEALHMADALNGSLAVFWIKPGGSKEVIPGEFLSPAGPGKLSK